MRSIELSPDAPGTIKHDAPGQYYLPDALPPDGFTTDAVADILQEATYELGRLAATSERITVSPLALTTLQRAEASASTRIEGAEMDLEEVYHHEMSEADPSDTKTAKDLQEVLSYEAALDEGLAHLDQGGVITLTLLRSLHDTLLSDVPRAEGPLGTFRESMVYLPSPTPGEEPFVPPSPPYLDDLMADIERYLHAEEFPTLVDAALVHYQLETVHPFADGNGRLGRVLVPLQLADAGLLPEPLLFLSPYFERHQTEYVRLLRQVSVEGAWVPWVRFFLTAVATQARAGIQTLQTLDDVRTAYAERYSGETATDRLAHLLFDEPYVDAAMVADRLDVSTQTAYNAIERLESDGVLEEVTGKDRGREYRASDIFGALGDHH
jgi:Fic family protein